MNDRILNQPSTPHPTVHDRGQYADTPTSIPWRGWWDITRRVVAELGQDRVSLVAAGVGFFALLAAFPALAAIISLVGLIASPGTIAQWLESLGGQLPDAVTETLLASVGDIASQPEQKLGLAAIAGILAALWSAKKGVAAVIQATNLAYEEQETRSWWRSLLQSVAFTVGSTLMFAFVLIVGVAIPLWIQESLQSAFVVGLLTVLQSLFLWVCGAMTLTALYRYAPDRAEPNWRWVSVGAGVATTLWMIGSLAFGYYAKDATSYEETYGSLAGVILTMLWLYLTGFVIILGAEINAEIEHQTATDTTVGPDKPLGERGAFVADHVAVGAGD